MKFKVAVVQFEIKEFQPDLNLKKAEKFIKQASGRADIIVFPEGFLTASTENKRYLVDFDGKYKNHFQMLAKKYKIDIVPGSFVEGDKTGVYNTTYFIDSSGKVKGKYRKINLWPEERKFTKAGNRLCVFDTKYGKCGLVICWDIMFPELFRKMAKIGTRIVFCPSFWVNGNNFEPYKKYNINAEVDHVNALCQARAIENNIVLIYSNIAGNIDSENEKSIGCSQITAPILGVLKKLNHNREGMFMQVVDTSILDDEENAYKIRSDLKTKVIY